MHTHRTIRHWLITIIAAIGVATVGASAQDSSSPPKKASKPYPEGINCLWLPNLRTQYTLIDDRHIVIEATRKKYYLLTLSRRCRDLDTTLDIGIESHGGQLCGPGDFIITDTDRCMIQYLEEVKSYDDARGVVDDRDDAEKEARRSGN